MDPTSVANIEIVEVGPRDGVQSHPIPIDVASRLAMIDQVVVSGVRRIEVASFVNPKVIPQMANAEALVAALPSRDDVVYIGLALNERGAARALATTINELGTVCVATDSLAIRNQSQTSDESLDVATKLVRLAREHGRRAQVTIGAAFGCPYEGEVDPDRIVAMASRAADGQPNEIALADTIGVATPDAVGSLIERVRTAICPIPVRAHFHNTRGTGIANVWAAVSAGAATIDASLGGLGGCPFAPGAAGNVATEDVAYLLARGGFATGLDVAKLILASTWLAETLGHALPGMVAKAGDFPGERRKVFLP